MNGLKNIVRIATLTIGLTFAGTSVSTFASDDFDSFKIINEIKETYQDIEVQNQLIEKVENGELLDSVNPDKKHLGVTEKVDPYTKVTTYPDGSQNTSIIDFSEATFYDEDGNVIKDDDLITPFGVEGGNWNKGSGYSCVSGAKVINRSLYVSVYFYANFCIHVGADDTISRIYGVDIATHYWSILSEGVFRDKEESNLTAYGGVKFQFRPKADSVLKTGYLYLRVAKDDYYLDTDFN